MSVIITSVILLFSLIFLGFGLGKSGTLRQDSASDMSALVIQVAMPATVFLSIVGQNRGELLDGSLWILLIMFLFHTVSFFLGILLIKIFRISGEEAGSWLYNIMFSNNGFVGIPLALAIFGTHGMLIMVLGNVISNLMMFSVGVRILTRGRKAELNMRSMVFNNLNIAVVLGFIVCLLQIPVPKVLLQFLGYLGNITSGLSMLVVGLSMSRTSFKEVLEQKKVVIVSMFRLLIIPALTVAAVAVLPIQISDLMKQVLILSAALPASAAQSMFAEKYHGNTKLAASNILITTMCSLITVPLVMKLVMK